MKYDTIKANAKRIYAEGLLAGAFDALLPFVLATASEREEMQAFAQSYNQHCNQDQKDWLANAACLRDDKKSWGTAWNQVVLRARETGLNLIDKWDVRRVGKLIELFPECVPAKMRNRQLNCFIADNADGDWMVEVA